MAIQIQLYKSVFSTYYFFAVHAVSSESRYIYLFKRNGMGLPNLHGSTGKKNISTKPCWVSQNNSTRDQAQGFSDLLKPHRSIRSVEKATRFFTGGNSTGAVERDRSLFFPLSPGQSSRICNALPCSGDLWDFANSSHKITTSFQPNCKIRTKELHGLLKLNC